MFAAKNKIGINGKYFLKQEKEKENFQFRKRFETFPMCSISYLIETTDMFVFT